MEENLNITAAESTEKRLLTLNSFELKLRKIYLENGFEIHTEEDIEEYYSACKPYIPERNSKIVRSYSSDQKLVRLSLTDEDHRRHISVAPHTRYFPIQLHVHDYIELLYIAGGQCEHICKGIHYTLSEGDFCFFEYGAPHTILGNSDDLIALNIMLDLEPFEEIFFSLLHSDSIITNFFRCILFDVSPAPMFIFQTGRDLHVKSQVYQMYEECVHPDDYSFYQLSSILNQIFIRLLRVHKDNLCTFSEEGRNPQILTILDYICAHYKTVTLQEVSEKFHYSTSYMSKIIKKNFNMTFKELVHRERMQTAARLLVNSSLSITEIAQETGFLISVISAAVFINATIWHPGNTEKRL
ncbi:MAG: AraC family transcriptional regulator [Clostridiales bacterium]|nr:AraC family transcriptional regulator [Clostridiales bacterium]